MATVKGDVHDIGKNIVGVVLGCNNYEVIDLGVMVPCDKILETAIAEEADMVGLRGLITPSLDEMVHVAQEMERREAGHAAADRRGHDPARHTAVKIAPQYSRDVVHVIDASRARASSRNSLNPRTAGASSSKANRAAQARDVETFKAARPRSSCPMPAACDKRWTTDWASARDRGARLSRPRALERVPLAELIPYHRLVAVLHGLGAEGQVPDDLRRPHRGRGGPQALRRRPAMLDEVIREGTLTARGVYGFFAADADGDDIVLFADDDRSRRNWPGSTPSGSSGSGRGRTSSMPWPTSSLRWRAAGTTTWGGSPCTAGHGCDELCRRYEADHDDYNAILVKALADRLAEAFAEWLHARSAGSGASAGTRASPATT